MEHSKRQMLREWDELMRTIGVIGQSEGELMRSCNLYTMQMKHVMAKTNSNHYNAITIMIRSLVLLPVRLSIQPTMLSIAWGGEDGMMFDIQVTTETVQAIREFEYLALSHGWATQSQNFLQRNPESATQTKSTVSCNQLISANQEWRFAALDTFETMLHGAVLLNPLIVPEMMQCVQYSVTQVTLECTNTTNTTNHSEIPTTSKLAAFCESIRTYCSVSPRQRHLLLLE